MALLGHSDCGCIARNKLFQVYYFMILRPERNGRHVASAIYKCVKTLNNILLTYGLLRLIHDKSMLIFVGHQTILRKLILIR